MLRVLLAIALLASFPFVVRAEDKPAREENQVVITVTIDKQSGEVKISISKDSENKKVIVSEKKHSRRRGK